MRHDPHKLVEGCLIAGFGMGAHAGYIYIRGEFYNEAQVLQARSTRPTTPACSARTPAARLRLRSLRAPRRRRLYLRRGDRADREPRGQEGQPRLKPPFPAASASTAARPRSTTSRPSRWCRRSCAAAPPGSPARPAEEHRHQDVLHLRPREQALQRRGGDGHPAEGAHRDARRRRARRLGQPAGVIPGGSSVPLPAEDICDDVLMDFDSLREVKSGLGTAA
jgi:NADH-quinone oxidoreductase subunit F